MKRRLKMRRISMMLTFFFLFWGHSAYCSVTGGPCQAENLKSFEALDNIIPDSLTEYLKDKGLDITSLRTVAAANGENKLFLSESDSEDGFIFLLKNADGSGVLILTGNNSSRQEGCALITFNSAENVFAPQQLSEGCVRQIFTTMQSLISAIFYCSVFGNPLDCGLEIIDLATNIYQLRIDCLDEE